MHCIFNGVGVLFCVGGSVRVIQREKGDNIVNTISKMSSIRFKQDVPASCICLGCLIVLMEIMTIA